VPQGSKGGATFFARVVQVAFEGAPKTIAKYQDDVLNFAPDFDSLLAAHHETYIRVAKYNLVLKQSAAKKKPLVTLRHQTIPPPRQDTSTSTTVYRPPTSGFLELSMMT
jgi:hypothetical protein